MNPLSEIINKHKDIKQAGSKGWNKQPKNSAAKLGAKHAARVSVDRAVKASLGNNIQSDIVSLILRRFVSKI